MQTIKSEPSDYSEYGDMKISPKRIRQDPMKDSLVYTIWNTKVVLSLMNRAERLDYKPI